MGSISEGNTRKKRPRAAALGFAGRVPVGSRTVDWSFLSCPPFRLGVVLAERPSEDIYDLTTETMMNGDSPGKY
jgi:hypothetical protein